MAAILRKIEDQASNRRADETSDVPANRVQPIAKERNQWGVITARWPMRAPTRPRCRGRHCGWAVQVYLGLPLPR